MKKFILNERGAQWVKAAHRKVEAQRYYSHSRSDQSHELEERRDIDAVMTRDRRTDASRHWRKGGAACREVLKARAKNFVRINESHEQAAKVAKSHIVT